MEEKSQNQEDKKIVKSYRIMPETAEAIEALAKTLGDKQIALNALLETYELQKNKEEVPEQTDNVERFQNYLFSLTNMYLEALKFAKDAKEIGRTASDALVRSKDQIIMEQQQKYAELQEEYEKFKQQSLACEKEYEEKRKVENDTYQKKEAQLLDVKLNYEKQQKKLEAIVEEKELLHSNYLGQVKINQEINDKIKDLQDVTMKLEKNEYVLKDQISKLTLERNQAISKSEDLERKLFALQADNEAIKERYEVEKKLIAEKAEYETRKKMEEEYENKLKKVREEADSYREKYFSELKKA